MPLSRQAALQGPAASLRAVGGSGVLLLRGALRASLGTIVQPQVSRPRWAAMATASVRPCAPSLAMMLLTCTLAVFSLM